MKKLFSIMFTILIILYFVACSSSKIPTDEEVSFAYQQAEEAYSWFDLTTMPVVNNSEIEYNGNTYLKVNHSSIKSFSDLETYLHSIFSDDIVDSLLENNRYVDIDGVLYASLADRGTNIFAGEQHHKIIRENGEKIIYKVSVDLLDDNLEKVVDKEIYTFAYEFSEKENRWLFTNFSLVW